MLFLHCSFGTGWRGVLLPSHNSVFSIKLVFMFNFYWSFSNIFCSKCPCFTTNAQNLTPSTIHFKQGICTNSRKSQSFHTYDAVTDGGHFLVHKSIRLVSFYITWVLYMVCVLEPEREASKPYIMLIKRPRLLIFHPDYW